MRTPMLLTSLCLLATLPAQLRQPITGVVTAADGKPAADADVTLAFSDQLARQLLPDDVVNVRTDASGRFRADVIAGRLYSGWASRAVPDAGGARMVSAIAEELAPGTRLAFTLARPHTDRLVTIDNAKAWIDRIGPLRATVSPYAANPATQPTEVDAEGTFRLPALPGERQLVRILDAAGTTLFADDIAADATAFPLPPPCEIPVHVTGADGAPIAGAAICHQVSNPEVPFGCFPRPTFWRRFRQGAVTDAKGDAVVCVPARRSPFEHPEQALFLVVHKAGFAEACGGWDGVRFENGEVRGDATGPLTFALQPEQPLAGQVLDARGQPCSNTTVQVIAECGIEHPSHTGSYSRVWTTETDAAGGYRCTWIPPTARVLRVTAVDQAAADAKSATMPANTSALPVDGSGRRVDLSRARQRDLEVTIVDEHGGPAAGAWALLLPVTEKDDDHVNWSERGGVGGNSRLRVLAPEGRWLLCVGTAEAIGYAEIEATTRSGPIQLQLQALATMHGTVRSGRKPRPGVGFSLVSCGWASEPTPFDRTLDRVAFWHTEANCPRITTDADGAFTLSFLDRPGLLRQIQAGDDSGTSSPFAVVAGERGTVVLQPR